MNPILKIRFNTGIRGNHTVNKSLKGTRVLRFYRNLSTTSPASTTTINNTKLKYPVLSASLILATSYLVYSSYRSKAEERELLDSVSSTLDISKESLQRIYSTTTTQELLRSYIVYKLCSSNLFVKLVPSLLSIKLPQQLDTLRSYLIENLAFNQFCAGNDDLQTLTTMEKLQRNGVGSILSPNIEWDVNNEEGVDFYNNSFQSYLKVIDLCKDSNSYVAVKITGLCDANLLIKLDELFAYLNRPNSDLIDCFDDKYKNSMKHTKLKVESMFKDKSKIDHTQLLQLYLSPANPNFYTDLQHITNFKFSSNELDTLQQFYQRMEQLTAVAQTKKVKLLIDAEHFKLQTTISNLTLYLMLQFNKKECTVYNTYQMYLKRNGINLYKDISMNDNLIDDLKFKFGVKMVRGAYINYESQNDNRESIHDNKRNTDEAYDTGIKFLVHRLKKNPSDLSIVLATHNINSINLATKLLSDTNNLQQKVTFAQLMGMRDFLTYKLKNQGFQALKCLPYGTLQQTVPYLVRRLQENNLFGKEVRLELLSLKLELWRRFYTWEGIHKLKF